MKIFVTGGAGYIGSHTVLELLQRDHEVAVYDNLSNSNNSALKRIEEFTSKKIKLIVGDVRNKALLKQSFVQWQPECVIHFAALKSVTDSILRPLEYYDVNINGLISLLMAMGEVDCRKILFSSSASVYGNPRYLPLDEQHPTFPLTPYGQSKLMSERIIADWVKSTPSYHAMCLRYFNPIGAHVSGLIGEGSSLGTANNLLPYIVNVALGRQPHLNIFGADYPTRDGTGERDYIHVTDLANFHAIALEKLPELDRAEIFNIGTGMGTTVLELVSAFEQATGINIPFVVKKRRDGDVPSSWADTTRAGTQLNFKAEKCILEACEDAWRWEKNRK